MSEQRLAFVHQVETYGQSVAEACRGFQISRKTGYKWLHRYRTDPNAPLSDRSRRPRVSPNQTSRRVEEAIVSLRDRWGWGARKIRRVLADQGMMVPSMKTVHAVLSRRGRLVVPQSKAKATGSFEWPTPNALWQLDHKSPVEIARQKSYPLTVLDDCSRYLLLFQPCSDQTIDGTWRLLWNVFGDVGLPDHLLSDNHFSSTHRSPRTVSRFDSYLIRLGIHPIHGRPYHPQTQGKVERVHRTIEQELYPRARFDSLEHFHQDAESWRHVYNFVRPHESLKDRPPGTRWLPSSRQRPDTLPCIEYDSGAVLRKVASTGDIRFRSCRILAGRGVAGQFVEVKETDFSIDLFFGFKKIRSIPFQQLEKGHFI